MAGLQRSAVSFRRQGSSGLVWDDKLIQAELMNQAANQRDNSSAGAGAGSSGDGSDNNTQQEIVPGGQEVKEDMTKASPRTGGSMERSRSNGGGGRGYRTGRVSPAIEPPSPKVSACGFCSAFGKLAGKAINNLVLHLQEDYTHSLTCRSADIRSSIVNRRDYEFSCSNSPAYPAHIFSKRRAHGNHYYSHKQQQHHQHLKHKDAHAVKKMFDMLNSYEKLEQGSMALPGFGQSPIVRQLRVTDSPYPVKDYEENPQVDKDAEDFINKFYKDLKLQRRVAAVESPSPYHYWVRR